MKNDSVAAVLVLLAVSTQGLALDGPEGARRAHRAPFQIFRALPSTAIEATAWCNGEPAPLPPLTPGDRASEFECWGKYEVEAPFQDFDAGLHEVRRLSVLSFAACDGQFQVSNELNATPQQRRQNGSMKARHTAADDGPAQMMLCKGKFWSSQAALCSYGAAHKHFAQVVTFGCSAELRTEDGTGGCQPQHGDHNASASESQTTSLRNFDASTPPGALHTAIIEHIQWLKAHDMAPQQSVDELASEGAGAADLAVRCQDSCDGSALQDKTSCQEGFTSTCTAALVTESYAVVQDIETKVLSAVNIKPESTSKACFGVLADSVERSGEDQAASRAADGLLENDVCIGLQSVTPMDSHGWAGVRITTVPRDDVLVNFGAFIGKRVL